MGPRNRLVIATALLLGHVSAACTSWRVPSVTPQELLARDHPAAIRVREQGGVKYVLVSPRLEGDSVTGYVKRVERRIPVAVIDGVAVRKFNALKTVWWSVAVPVLALGALAGVACAGGGCDLNGVGGSWSFAP
jgi:hypothetical protein